ncbi:hypothetical protein [Streptomyces sp. A012304]|uniref:hypothetical protein n=1 Tax=Streptomyces sp. A012304 TaxID=375446 RepID=UPI00223287D9|nr:hypothetical protein [Streptomyces sp. A012304]GKQ34478.1 hypothetical protein ALMP_10270 [Streptomyces sp. A012304]
MKSDGTYTTIPRSVGIAWCAWHQGYSVTARLVRDAAGARHFACFSCREAYDLVPIADQP